ncbi:MAG: isoprenylcysteine carboxylmethyltransferase family protein [Elusimicrobia bacterium]|nr:isoprenylcysteine carboxylmethyltransferase family protein [Elusimicrobiota bacterium]
MYNNLRRFIAFLFAIVVLYFAVKTEMLFYWAIIFIFFGEIIRVWAAGYIRKNKILSIVGPYKYVRNPLYVGSLLIGIGFGLFIWNFYILAFIVVLFIVIYTLQINSEEKELKNIFGEKYLDYKKNVRRWLPGIKPYGLENGEFDVKLAIFKNREYNAIFGCIGMILAILILRKI